MSTTTLQHPETHDDVISASLATLVLQNTIEKFDKGKAQLLERLNQYPHGIDAAVAKISNLLLVPSGNSGRSAYVFFSPRNAPSFANSIAGLLRISTRCSVPSVA